MKIFLLYAILIFAKKAPKMIMDLLNIKSEGVGLKGLNIKNKMGEAAIVGGAVKKGMTDLHGRARKGAAGFTSGLIHGQGKLKDKLRLPKKGKPGSGGDAFKGLMTGLASGGEDARGNGENGLKGIWSKGWGDTRDVFRGGKPRLGERINAKFDKLSGGMASQGNSSLTTAHAKETEKLLEALSKKVGKDGALKIMAQLVNKHGVNGRVRFDHSDEFEAFKKDLKGLAEAYTPENMAEILSRNSSLLQDAQGNYVADAKTLSSQAAANFITDLNIDRYGSSILMKKDLLTERGKVLDKILKYNEDIERAHNANDFATETRLISNRDDAITKAEAEGLFNNYANFGVDAIGGEKDPVTKQWIIDPTTGRTKFNPKDLLGKLSEEITTNTKKLKGTENDIEGMKAVEAEKPGDKK